MYDTQRYNVAHICKTSYSNPLWHFIFDLYICLPVICALIWLWTKEQRNTYNACILKYELMHI